MHKLKLPQVTETMQTGTVIRWVKAQGDTVDKGEVLVVVETEEDRLELTAGQGGRLVQILAPEGTTVPVGADLAALEDAAGPADRPQAPPSAPPAVPQAAPPEPAGNVVPLVMPQAGNTMEEGTIVKWRVSEGDTISIGDVIYEAETDKATIEVEADHAGTIARIVAHEGDTVPIKVPVAYLGDNPADVDAYLAAHPQPALVEKAAAAPAEPAAAQAAPAAGPAAVTEAGRIKASPAARKAAAERGLDLAAVGAGSGPGGRILLADLDRAAPGAAAVAAPKITPEGATRRPMSSMRRAIARNLLASKQNIPHYYMRLTIDAEAMYDFYKGEKAKYSCTLNDVVALACAKVIMEVPAFRSRLDGDDIIEFPTANVGIAVGVEDGLVVPVVVGANLLDLKRLAAKTKEMVEAARGGKIEGMGQGVFTITNLGMFGVEEFAAIINPPEPAILAVGALRDDVVVRDGKVRSGRVMTMTLSGDHRIVDGLVAAQFMARLKELLEDPSQLV